MIPARPSGAGQRAALLALALVAALATLTVLAGRAEAAGYRYWSFWRGADGGWSYQQQGPATYVPADGSVDGWRFALSPDGGQDAARPTGGAADFAVLCADTPAKPGLKRVGVVLDFGTRTDAPSGSVPPAARTGCAQVRQQASSAEVLAALAPPLRYDTNGMLCAIAGYPAAGCGEAVSGSSGTSGSTTSGATKAPSSGPNLGLAAGGALVVLLGAGAVWQVRRRRRT
ncbi:SCO2322 family protein [Kitasatospora sp. NBC_01302]|uniref:SCO2322 family protein n=1 Tax=Kitasatospora sp. NBC_01302 TaxID=2903575 RepID=UPI002E1516CF|nr:SCO2322 family protein [Kitasatospora sp. NBC_01302]